MKATQKIFYEDTHIIDFTATVTDCIPLEGNSQYQIVLDQTAFFPEEGGQPADKGTLELPSSAEASENVFEVLDVQIKDNIIFHTIACPLVPGSTINGHVDWSQRFDFMQQHSGEHIVSGLIHSRFGLDNVGFHLGSSEVTLDMNGELDRVQLRAIEREANEIIWRNLPVWISYPTPEELTALEYRSKLELTENVRIVTIPGVDACACCAPHVDTTGQIGMIKITGVMRHRGGVRVHILCGGRALADYTEKQDSVTALSVLLSAKPNAVAESAAHLKEENQHFREECNRLQIKLLTSLLQSLPAPADSDHALLFVDEMNDVTMRNAVNELVTKYAGYCGIFTGSDAHGYRFIVGSNHHDCRELAKALREHLQAKGGGSAPMIQGSVQAAKEQIQQYFQ